MASAGMLVEREPDWTENAGPATAISTENKFPPHALHSNTERWLMKPGDGCDDDARLHDWKDDKLAPLFDTMYITADDDAVRQDGNPCPAIMYLFFALLLLAVACPRSVGSIRRLLFATARFSGHVARIEMERSRLLFTRLLLVRILVVTHEMLL